MTLPGLVMVLAAAAIMAWVSRSIGDGTRGHATTSASLDLMSELFSPADLRRQDEQRHEALRRDDVEDGAPPRSQVDLVAGTARIRIPQPLTRAPQKVS